MDENLERAQQESVELAAAAQLRAREAIDAMKNEAAGGAERAADAVEAATEGLAEDRDDALSGYGQSLASMMRRLAGGLRENDIDDFAHEVAEFARRNPGAFIAGSVALGFGISRFLKASGHRSSNGFEGTEDAP